MVASEPGVDCVPLFYKDLEHEKDEKPGVFKGKFDQMITLTDERKDILYKWIQFLPLAQKPIIRNAPGVIFTVIQAKQAGVELIKQTIQILGDYGMNFF
jgi:hypothetical protein